MFSQIIDKFIEKSPITVMAQGLLEHLLNQDKLDEWFENNSGTQYTHKLLFSSVIDIMLSVVCQVRSTVHVAFQKSAINLKRDKIRNW